jgi:putative membrane protein
LLLRWLLAAVHLLALVLGTLAVANRARAFSSTLDAPGLKRLFAADAKWGLAAILWISTGLWRLFASTEMPTAFYLENQAFWVKMGLFVLILLLELVPMIALVRWRIALRRGESLDTSRAGFYAGISRVQLVLVVLMVFAATAMARGIGL